MEMPFQPNEGKNLEIDTDYGRYARYPVKTHVITKDDVLEDVLDKYVREYIQPGDTIIMSEKIVAISQGRAFPIEEIKVSRLAKILSHFVVKTNYGIGLGMPETMELCIREVVQGGKVASSVTLCPSAKLHLEVTPSHTELTEGDTYDMAAVRVRILDEYGSPSPYAQLPVTFRLEGAAQLVGPEVTAAEGGMTGTYVKTTGETGTAVLTVTTSQTEAVRIAFTVGRKPER